MTDRTPLIVRDGLDRSELAVVALSEAAANAIAAVMDAHEDDFRKALGQEGVAWEDVMQPDWFRVVRLEDAEFAISRHYREDGSTS